ncbi:hypothetical protein Leryth_006925 [Lithospermum erythrorhizon]|nr:hypothetical protein Leryth_006925 [Lithospermum erythrorhizon]
MVLWSAENATEAYINAMKLAKINHKEPDVAEFISALAAGSNAKLMVIACPNASDYSATLALVAAAHQTGGRVVCILGDTNQEKILKYNLGENSDYVTFVMGDIRVLLKSEYKDVDFIVIDCKIEDSKDVLRDVRGVVEKNAVVLGYNARFMGSLRNFGVNNNNVSAHFLPIGHGILVTRIAKSEGVSKRKSKWIVKVDNCTGEEHVFRIIGQPSKLKVGGA